MSLMLRYRVLLTYDKRSFLFGYDAGVMTDVIASKNFLEYFNTDSTSPIIGAINSTFSGGAAVGALMGGLVMDRFGRRRTIQLGAFVCVIGAILQSASRNLSMILVGRILAGWAIGMMSMSIPVYQSECAHPKMRGLIVGLTQQMIGVGFIVSTWVGYGSLQASDSSTFQWRFPLAFQALPAFLLAIGLFFLPESPRQLIEQDRLEDGLKILRKLHYDNTNEDWIMKEYNEIRATIQAEKAITTSGWKVLFTVPQWRTRLMHGVAVQVFTQLTGEALWEQVSLASTPIKLILIPANVGINVINYYQTIMYDALGITGNRNLLVTGIYNVLGPITNFIFITFILDRVGRRKPLIFGAIGITIALFCEAAINSQNAEGTKRGLSIAGVFFLFSVTIIYSLSFGSVSWVYMSEIMPMQIRGKGNAFATGVGNWVVSTFFAQVSPIALGKITWKYYFVFAGGF